MLPSRRSLVAAGAALALLAGCSAGAGERQPGDAITATEAELLAGLLARNAEAGGAEFVVTAPFGEDALLTLIGEVDYVGGIGRAQAVADHGTGDDVVRTVFFTADELWFGDVPGLGEALAAAALPAAGYLRRPATPPGGDADGTAPLADVLVRLVLDLGAPADDDPGRIRDADYTWQGRRSIDGRLSTVFGSPSGWTVAVDSSSELLLQFATELPGDGPRVTVSLADHGTREIGLPAAEDSVDGAAHPGLAAAIGL